MNIDYYITEFPYTCTITRESINEDLPLSEITDETSIVYEGVCDIQQGGHNQVNNLINCNYVLYTPNGVIINNGDIVKADYGGIEVSGVVVGSFRSVLGGSVIYF